MKFNRISAREDVELIRDACRSLQLDAEMTALILGSYRRDRKLVITPKDDHEEILGYVMRKRKLWEDIFEESSSSR